MNLSQQLARLALANVAPGQMHYLTKSQMTDLALKVLHYVETRPPERLKTLIILAHSRTGTTDPDETVPWIENDLHQSEIELAYGFLAWVHQTQAFIHSSTFDNTWIGWRHSVEGKTPSQNATLVRMEKQLNPDDAPPPPPCPQCGASMRLVETPEWEPFWGCGQYPACRGHRIYRPNEERQW